VGANGPEADEIRVFGLELINNALSAGKASFIKHECLMEILQIDLFQAMHKAARSSNLAALAGSCSVSLSLYVHLGKRMLLQLEAFIETVLLRIAEGKSSTYEQQEAALEVAPLSPSPQQTHFFMSFSRDIDWYKSSMS
jgi:hypothetical protein